MSRSLFTSRLFISGSRDESPAHFQRSDCMKKLEFCLRFCLCLVMLGGIGSTNVFAQGGRASLSGHIVDPSGAVLQGAQIIVQPMGLNVQSDSQGDFTVRDLAGGTVHLIVSYV